ncbi:MAG: response regulator [bacterium]|nr:response regulator [bacterium]
MNEPPIGSVVRKKERGNVWVVEDEEDVRHLLGEQLESRGYRATLLRDGYEFLEMVKAKSLPLPDSIICDWHLEPRDQKLPRIDAPAVLRMAEHHFPKTPVIVITGWHKSLDDLHKVMLCGARAFLTKPYTLEELLDKLSAVTRAKAPPQNRPRPVSKQEAVRIEPKLVQKGRDVPAGNGRTAEGAGRNLPAPKVGATNGVPSPAASASEIEPRHLPPAEELLEEDVVRDYAVSFEDLITDFEEGLLVLESHFENGQLEDFAGAFEVAQRGYRALHTLKGNAGFLKAYHSQKLIHRLEDILGDVRTHLGSLNAALVRRLIDHFLVGKDVLTGICSFMQTHRRESGYETTPAYGLYERLLSDIDTLGKEFQKVGSGAKEEAGTFDDMF